MARRLRPQFEDATYHINSVGVRRSLIFPDDDARSMFLGILGVAVAKYLWVCGAYCLLGTHYHLLVKTPDANVGDGMKFVNGLYAQWFNATYGKRGHAFESRYYSVLLETSAHVQNAARYIARNPVQAGICSEPGHWQWSSYRASVGDVRTPRLLTPELVLDEFDDRPNIARDLFRRFVEGHGSDDWPPEGPTLYSLQFSHRV